MKHPGDQLARDLVQTAMAFHAARLWEQFASHECFALRVATEPLPLFASIMGQAGQEVGLALYRGEQALSQLRTILAGDPIEDDLMDETSQLAFGVDSFRDIAPDLRDVLQRAGFSPRREALAPFFLAKPSGRQARRPSRAEEKTLLYALKAVLQTHGDGRFRPVAIQGTDDVLTLVISGPVDAPDVGVEIVTYHDSRAVVIRSPVAAPTDLDLLPRTDERWLVGMPIMPTRVAGDDRSVRAVIVADERTTHVLGVETVLGGDLETAAATVFEMIRGRNSRERSGLPASVVFSSHALFDVLSPALATLDVTCEYEGDHPALRHIGAELEKFVTHQGRRDPTPAEPEADDLDGWKAVEMELSELLVHRAARGRRYGPRPLQRYFGDARAGDARLEEADEAGPAYPFFEWLVTDYRPATSSRSIVEKMLDETLTPAQRQLLRARRESAPSLYRIDAVTSGETLTFVDLITGRRHLVHDLAMSESAAVDVCLAARLIAAGAFTFVIPLSPPLGAGEVVEALDHLASLGFEVTPELLREAPHLLGRLWAWHDARYRPGSARVRMCNSDGDDLVWLTAAYDVQDPAALSDVLDSRPDVELDSDTGEYVWLQTSEALPRARRDLARLELVDQELLVGVSSEERLERVRDWLERIDGLHLVDVVEAAPGAPWPRSGRSGARADVADRPGPPATSPGSRERSCRDYVQWLDQPLATLAGRTPREACQNEAGRRRVAIIIRAMVRPDWGSADGRLEVPREAMLRALGLDGQG